MSENLMTSKAIIPYAQAMLDITSNKIAPTDKITEDLLAVRDLFVTTPQLNEYFNNPTVSKDAKYKLLKRVFRSAKLHPIIQNFLKVLIKRDRIILVKPIVDKFLYLSRKFSSYKLVTIYVPYSPFADEYEVRILEKLGELTQARTVETNTYVDETLIGGFVVETESKVIDFSVKNKLKMLAKHLDAALEI